MSLRGINNDLQRVQKIMEGWNASDSVSDIERELVLDKLKSIYEQVMFFEREKIADSEPMQWINMDSQAQDMPIEVFESESVAIVSETTVADPESVCPAPESITECGQSSAPVFKHKLDRSVIMSLYGDDDASVSQEKIVQQGVAESTFQQDPEPVIDLEFVEEPVVELAMEPEEEPTEQGDAVEPQLHKVELQTDDEQESEQEFVQESEQEPTPTPQPVQEPTPVEVPFEMIAMSSEPKYTPKIEVVKMHNSSASEIDKPHGQVLGDVINAGETLGDSFARNSTKTDIATKIVTHQATDLRKSIGINDKFLMIRDMFSGDASAFERAMHSLEEFDDLNDALLYIHDTYHWNPNSDGVKLLIELLTRKLS